MMLSITISRYMASFLQGEFSREWTGVFGSYMQSKYSSFFLLRLIIELISVIPPLNCLQVHMPVVEAQHKHSFILQWSFCVLKGTFPGQNIFFSYPKSLSLQKKVLYVKFNAPTWKPGMIKLPEYKTWEKQTNKWGFSCYRLLGSIAVETDEFS